MKIFKEEPIRQIIGNIQETIKGTHFAGNVYISGEALYNALLHRPIDYLGILVNQVRGGELLANFLAAKNHCYQSTVNPIVYGKSGAARLFLPLNDAAQKIPLNCMQTMKKMGGVDTLAADCFGTLQEHAQTFSTTIHGLVYNVSNEKIQDPNNLGAHDIINQIIRCPQNKSYTFKDYPLTMLQIIRVSAELGWGIAKDTWMEIIKNAQYITQAEQLEVTREFSKILLSSNPSFGVRKLLNCGLLNYIAPDIYGLTGAFESKNPMVTSFDHSLAMLDDVQPIIEHRLAALFHDISKIVASNSSTAWGRDKLSSADDFSANATMMDLQAMGYATATINSVVTAIKYHHFFNRYTDGVTPPDRRIRKFLNECGDDFVITLDLMQANNTHCTYNRKPQQVNLVLKRIEEMSAEEKERKEKMPIDGKDLMAEFNLKPGPAIGKILGAIKRAYKKNPNITKDECFAVAQSTIKRLSL